MHKYIHINSGNTIHYLEFGKGEPLVLVPSLWVTSNSYTVLWRTLGKHFTVYIPDIFRGNSRFSKNATSIDEYVNLLTEFIRRTKLKNYYLVGISLSGIVATKYIFNGSHLPRKLFLASTTVLPLDIKNQRFSLFLGYLKLLYHNMFSIEGYANNWLWITDGLENLLKHSRQAWNEGLIATSLEMEHITSMPIPTKLVFALGDEFLPTEGATRLAKVKNLDLEVVERHHAWFFRHEKDLVEKIVHFFNGNSASTS